jgi:hypothetical protein
MEKKSWHGEKTSSHMVKKLPDLWCKSHPDIYIMVKKAWQGEKTSSHMVKKFPDLIMVKMAS